jgi:hypothetical protein
VGRAPPESRVAYLCSPAPQDFAAIQRLRSGTMVALQLSTEYGGSLLPQC